MEPLDNELYPRHLVPTLLPHYTIFMLVETRNLCRALHKNLHWASRLGSPMFRVSLPVCCPSRPWWYVTLKGYLRTTKQITAHPLHPGVHSWGLNEYSLMGSTGHPETEFFPFTSDSLKLSIGSVRETLKTSGHEWVPLYDTLPFHQVTCGFSNI